MLNSAPVLKETLTFDHNCISLMAPDRITEKMNNIVKGRIISCGELKSKYMRNGLTMLFVYKISGSIKTEIKGIMVPKVMISNKEVTIVKINRKIN